MIKIKWVIVGFVVWFFLMAGVKAMEHTQCEHTEADLGKKATEISNICK